MGGNVRVGLEDSLYIGRGKLAKSNAEQVAKMRHLIEELGYHEVDVAGVSWGGGIAQQFAHQYPNLCRRLVLAATAPGVIMPLAPARSVRASLAASWIRRSV